MKIFVALASTPKQYAEDALEYFTSTFSLKLYVRQSDNKFLTFVLDPDKDTGTGFVIKDVNETGAYRHVIVRKVVEGKRLWRKEIRVPNSVPKDKVMVYIINNIRPSLLAIV